MVPLRRAAVASLAFVTLWVCGEGGSASGKPTARELLQAMGRGVNLGNIYDLDTGNNMSFEAQRDRIDRFQSLGFTHVRVPVTWGEKYTYEGKVLLVEQVVRYALDRNLSVILNTHHEHWLKFHYDGTAEYDDMFAELWTSIATLFQDDGADLVFEVLNEPEGVMGGYGPGHEDPKNETAINLTRMINQVGYDAIRRISPERVVLVMPNGMGGHSQAKMVYPTADMLPGGGQDDFLGVSVHTYDPWEFCGQTGQLSQFHDIDAMKTHEKQTHAPFLAWAAELGVPVHIGEYGVGRTDERTAERNHPLVHEYYKFVTNFFADQNIPTTVWDDQGWFCIQNSAGEFVFRLADSILSTYSASGMSTILVWCLCGVLIAALAGLLLVFVCPRSGSKGMTLISAESSAESSAGSPSE